MILNQQYTPLSIDTIKIYNFQLLFTCDLELTLQIVPLKYIAGVLLYGHSVNLYRNLNINIFSYNFSKYKLVIKITVLM